jgi:hypothetical protein
MLVLGLSEQLRGTGKPLPRSMVQFPDTERVCIE